MKISFNQPYFTGKELDYIRDAILNKAHTAGCGHYTLACQKILQSMTGTKAALLTTSCTDALEMSALLLDIQPGDEVILPSFTFVSTANAFVLRGARPRFVDIDPEHLCISTNDLQAAINQNTRAVVPVHYAGCSCDMDELLRIARDHKLQVVEDAAQAIGGFYLHSPLGSLGDLACLSFHETKNIISGEGGALLVNNPAFLQRAEIIWEKGTNRRQFYRGEVDKYTWVDVGSSFLPSEIIAAYLYAQLQERETIQSLRKNVFLRYLKRLQRAAQQGYIRLPHTPLYNTATYHMFYILLETGALRDRLLQYLRDKGILAVFHYIPLHLSGMGKQFGYQAGDFPVCEAVAQRLLRLPFYNELSIIQQDYIVMHIERFFASL